MDSSAEAGKETKTMEALRWLAQNPGKTPYAAAKHTGINKSVLYRAMKRIQRPQAEFPAPIHHFTQTNGTRVERRLNKTDLMWVALLRDTSLDVQSCGGTIRIGKHHLLYTEFEALCEQVDGDIRLLVTRAQGLLDDVAGNYLSTSPKAKP